MVEGLVEQAMEGQRGARVCSMIVTPQMVRVVLFWLLYCVVGRLVNRVLGLLSLGATVQSSRQICVSWGDPIQRISLVFGSRN